MNNNYIELSKNEEQVLQTLWRENRPLSRGEIISLTFNKTWKESSIHILLNQLLEKKAIEVNSITKIGKGYGRTYSPILKKNEYDFEKLKNETILLSPDISAVKNYVSFLVEKSDFTEKELKELEDLIGDKI